MLGPFRERREGKILNGEVEGWEVTLAAASFGWDISLGFLVLGAEASRRLVCALQHICTHTCVYELVTNVAAGRPCTERRLSW